MTQYTGNKKRHDRVSCLFLFQAYDLEGQEGPWKYPVNVNEFEKLTQPISRVMSLNDHLSRPAVTNRFERPTRERDGQPHSPLFGLASSGVYRACLVTKTAVSSYLAFPPLPVCTGGIFLLH